MSDPQGSPHALRFPAESTQYRQARDALLHAEMALRRQIETVAALRRALPPGGAVPEDYVFEEGAEAHPVRLSELFGGHDTLVVYSFMYGPKMARPCPSCTSILDSLDRTVRHSQARVATVAVARSPVGRVLEFARERGWSRLRLLSSAGNTYNADYHAEDATGSQWPALNVFTRDASGIRHAYATELLFAPKEPGQDGRHVDSIWPLWNLLDFTPGGRGTDFRPTLD